jgi:hypothetical protein
MWDIIIDKINEIIFIVCTYICDALTDRLEETIPDY